jgi:hydroxymethylpyrimidine/phosphomethylpyrimidine kinase
MKNNSTPYTLHSTLDKPVLLISASDSSAAAGMQVDLRVLNDLGVPARCAITAVTVQGDGGAKSINPVDTGFIVDSINTALSDPPGIGAVKVGLLGNALTAEALQEPLSELHGSGVPIVVDPVMRSTPGSALSTEDTAGAMLEKILPWGTLLTPNRDEFEALSILIDTVDSDETAKVHRLMEYGAGGILVTGGDTNEDQCTDILYKKDGTVTDFQHPRIGTRAPRGTGCALSTAIAVYLSRGLPMGEAVGRSIEYVTGLIEKAAMVGDQLLLFPGETWKKPFDTETGRHGDTE